MLAECLIERLLLDDILRPEMLKKRDFRNVKLEKYHWIESGSFKEVLDMRISY